MINNLQMECTKSMDIIYDYIKNKKIDTSLLYKSIYPQLPLASTWGLVDTVGDTGGLITTDLVYTERSLDNRYIYTIVISIKNRLMIESCNSNPVVNCMCIYTSTLDIIEGYISYNIPYDMLNIALAKLEFIDDEPPILPPIIHDSSIYQKIIVGLVIIIVGTYIYKEYIEKKKYQFNN